MKNRRIVALILAFCMLLPLVACAQNAEDAADEAPFKNINITFSSDMPEEYAALSFPESSDNGTTKSYRIFPHYWYEDEAWEMTRVGLLKYADAIDEVALFCDQLNAPYMSDELLEEYCGIVEKRMKDLREMGVPSVGLNIMQTVGQGDYAVGTLPVHKMQSAVDYNGYVSSTQLCHNSEKFREFIAKKYAAFAATGPDFIWIDDDFRAADGKTAIYTCFCDSCIAQFNELHGKDYNREKLTNVLNSNAERSEQVRVLRELWTDFVITGYEEVMTIIKDAVAEVDPEIEMGLMIVHLASSTYLLGRWQELVDALGADKVRPGGGQHDEHNPLGIVDKVIASAHQLLQAQGVEDTQYEYEDFPQTHYKSPKTHILECTAAIMAGCSGIAFASMPSLGNDDVMRAIQAATPMWDDIGNTTGDWKNYGASMLWSEDNTLYGGAGRYFQQDWHIFSPMLSLFSYGNVLSFTAYIENSSFTVIYDTMAQTVTEEQLNIIFSRGALIDEAGAAILRNRGYGDLVGTAEEGTPCEWYAGYTYENSLGGRVVVVDERLSISSYYLGEANEKFRALVDWASNGKNPLNIDLPRVASFLKQPEDRSEFMFMVINTSNDTTDEFTVSILGEYEGDFICYDENGTASTIPASNAVIENGRTIITLPALTCWGFCVVRTA